MQLYAGSKYARADIDALKPNAAIVHAVPLKPDMMDERDDAGNSTGRLRRWAQGARGQQRMAAAQGDGKSYTCQAVWLMSNLQPNTCLLQDLPIHSNARHCNQTSCCLDQVRIADQMLVLFARRFSDLISGTVFEQVVVWGGVCVCAAGSKRRHPSATW